VNRVAHELMDVERRTDELAALRVQLRESEQQLARLAALEREAEKAAEERKEMDALRTRVDVLETQLARLEAARQELQSAHTALALSLERSQNVIDAMKSSPSWRLTAPLRRLKALLRRRR
jgi:DNA repair exonuclease SbcCD ATPase subunit